MVDARPILPAANPEPVRCGNCGEGELHFALLPRAGRVGPVYGFHCSACAYTFADPVH